MDGEREDQDLINLKKSLSWQPPQESKEKTPFFFSFFWTFFQRLVKLDFELFRRENGDRLVGPYYSSIIGFFLICICHQRFLI